MRRILCLTAAKPSELAEILNRPGQRRMDLAAWVAADRTLWRLGAKAGLGMQEVLPSGAGLEQSGAVSGRAGQSRLGPVLAAHRRPHQRTGLVRQQLLRCVRYQDAVQTCRDFDPSSIQSASKHPEARNSHMNQLQWEYASFSSRHRPHKHCSSCVHSHYVRVIWGQRQALHLCAMAFHDGCAHALIILPSPHSSVSCNAPPARQHSKKSLLQKINGTRRLGFEAGAACSTVCAH